MNGNYYEKVTMTFYQTKVKSITGPGVTALSWLKLIEQKMDKNEKGYTKRKYVNTWKRSEKDIEAVTNKNEKVWYLPHLNTLHFTAELT